MGGQIVAAFRVDELRQDIVTGKQANWEAIHRCYDRWHEEYPLDRARHAWAVLAMLEGGSGSVSAAFLGQELKAAVQTSGWICAQVYENKAKDFRDQFRTSTFRNAAEMEQVLGKADDDAFVNVVREENQRFGELIARVAKKLQLVEDKV
jgi:hypothetical protein